MAGLWCFFDKGDKIMNDDLEKCLRKAIKYLMPEKEYDFKISFETLIEIRKFLMKQEESFYKDCFPQTYEYDRCPGRTEYNLDGCIYKGIMNENYFSLESYILYRDKQDQWNTLKECIELDSKCFVKKRNIDDAYSYRYLNEVDHFFSYWIVRYLREKSGADYSRAKIQDCAIKFLMWKDMHIMIKNI